MTSNSMQETLGLEELDIDLYRSRQLWLPIGARGVFGGQIIGLALAATNKTVGSEFHVHSLHCYFILPGDASIPIIFKVSRVRDGRSYITRSVEARQRGLSIFIMLLSYKIPETFILEHQYPMPKVPPPEECTDTETRLRAWLNDARAAKFHNLIRMRLEQPFPVEFRHIGHRHLGMNELEPIKMTWMKTKEKLPDHVNLHHCVAAYLSDHELLNVSLIPHGLAKISERKARQLSVMTSLDHTIWFHAPYRVDDWLLYVMESPRTVDGRGFCHGRVYTRNGTLVMSVAQEGVVRFREVTENNTNGKSKL